MALVKFQNGNRESSVNPWLNDVFDSFFNDSFISDRLTSRVPAVNIAENENEYHIELAAPGLNKEDFKINLEKNILSISVEKKSENTEENKKFNRREFSYSSFVRSFTLPEGADQNNVDASYVNGVLTITVGKKEEAKQLSREIAIK